MTIMKSDTSHVSIAENLQELIDAKADIKSAIESKGVEVTGGLTTYADAIREIETGDIIVEGSGIDYTLIGWTIDDSVAQNEIDKTISNKDIEYSKMVMEKFKDGFNVAYGQSDYDLWYSLYRNIVYMPIVNSSTQTDFSNLFGRAYTSSNNTRPALKVFPSLNTLYARDMEFMFRGCHELESVGLLDCTNVQFIEQMFVGCNRLQHLEGFTNLGLSIKTSASLADGCLYLRDSPILTTESVLNVFNTIASVSTSKQCSITLHNDVMDKLTAEDIAIATNKGWTVSV